MSTLLLNKDQVGALCDLDEIFGAIEDGYKNLNQGKVVLPPIMDIFKPNTDGVIDFKASLDEGAGFFGMKASSGGFDNSALGMPPGYNLVFLWDAETSYPSCIMDATHIRNLRTAAAAAVSIKYLSREDASVYMAYGTGRLGKASLRATMRIRNIKEVYCFGWLPGENEAFCEEMGKEFPDVVFHGCNTPEEGVRKADIVVSVTLAKSGPIIKKEWIKKGAHLVDIGVDNQTKQEFYPDVMEIVDKLVDDNIEAASTKGETYQAIKAGVIKPEDIYGEIGDIILGKIPGRENDDEVTFFDTVGLGVQDLAMAVCIYKKAVAKGIGTQFEFYTM